MELPPSVSGADQLTLISELDGVATILLGCPGGSATSTLSDKSEY